MASTVISEVASEQVTAPGAAAAIASLPANVLPAGTYRLTCHAGYVSGTLGAPEQATNGNISLYVAGLATPLGIPAALGYYGPFSFVVQLDGASAVSVGSGVSPASTGVVYSAMIVADRLVSGAVVDAG